MSYILDALKKAESERALGSVPDLHAQPVPLVTIDGKPALWRRPLIWVAAGLLIALVILVRFEPWRATPAPVALAPQAASPAAPVPAPAAVPQPPVAAPAPAAPVAPAAPAAPAIAGAPTVIAPPVNPAPSRESAPAVAKAEPPKPKPRPKEKPVEPAAVARPPAAAPVEAAPAPTPAPAPAPAVAEAYIPALRELPANIQREIPALTVGGYIYASKPAERSILINNRLLREGEQIAPGLTLETMRPREAVLNYRGYRYRISY